MAATKNPNKDRVFIQTITPVGTLLFPHLAAPDTTQPYGDGKYKLTLLLPKDKGLGKLADAIKDCAMKAFGKDTAKVIMPVKDGDTKVNSEGQPVDFYKGCWYLTAKSKRAPILLDAQKKPIADPLSLRMGDKVRCVVVACSYTLNSPLAGGRVNGVTLLLDAVQKIADGDGTLGGQRSVALLDAEELPEEYQQAADEAQAATALFGGPF